MIVTTEAFPNGLRCGACSEEIWVGAAYFGALDGMTSDGTPVEILVCAYCARPSEISMLLFDHGFRAWKRD